MNITISWLIEFLNADLQGHKMSNDYYIIFFYLFATQFNDHQARLSHWPTG